MECGKIQNKRAIISLLVGAILFSAAIVAIPVGAALPTIHVYSGQSIQTAIDLATEGSTIVVHPGIYNEFVGIGKPLTLKGIRATIDQSQPGGYAVGMGASGISISGFTIKAGAVAIHAGGDWSSGLITGNEIYASDENGIGVVINQSIKTCN